MMTAHVVRTSALTMYVAMKDSHSPRHTRGNRGRSSGAISASRTSEFLMLQALSAKNANQ